ncbi:MAG: helix-turn-helix transcriptional regulator [Bauldia sp.]|nr:helix-turn-helix transcriptional regulator [Bauldia sp.]
MKLADYLAATRTTHAAFAGQIGVSQAAVSRYAGGRRVPEPEHMTRIAAATGGAVTANDFYALEPQQPPGFAESAEPMAGRRRIAVKPATADREAAAARWRAENAEAIRSFNEHIERDGVFGEEWRSW